MTDPQKVPPGKPPAIGSIVTVPLLHPLSVHRACGNECWQDGQRGRVVELMAPPAGDDSDNPEVCLEIDGADGVWFAWFRASDIQAGTLDDPEFSLSIDAMVSRQRPRRLADGRIEFLFPETDEWWFGDCYEGPTGP